MMSDATGSSGFISSGFWYFVGVSIGVLVIITALTIASYLCARSRLPIPLPPHRINALHHSQPHLSAVEVQGIDEATILGYPKLLFCEANKLKDSDGHGPNAATCCSICLSDYNDTDTVRVLPECDHLFHLPCVDPWLRMHPTYPNCRTSPLSTPPAQVVYSTADSAS
ncbi:RING-H2 finger protein ATL70-like [Prosopis cineraria]|uniref:RING-H2 finger protein ATL70-like n=1 Tax=Prosopis cineraria TaxID=364024 RepID=UPI00240EE7A1|nr:RING-H2 finger protein ATL70-like [Prosopis cineraria]